MHYPDLKQNTKYPKIRQLRYVLTIENSLSKQVVSRDSIWNSPTAFGVGKVVM